MGWLNYGRSNVGVQRITDIALHAGDADVLTRLRATQRRYILDLFSGQLDLAYVNHRLRIGLVHKQLGVEPKLYLSAVKTLKGPALPFLGPAGADALSAQKRLNFIRSCTCHKVGPLVVTTLSTDHDSPGGFGHLAAPQAGAYSYETVLARERDTR